MNRSRALISAREHILAPGAVHVNKKNSQMRTIAARLAQIRRETGLSAADFAKRLWECAGYKVSDVSVLGYEGGGKGTAKVPVQYCRAVAQTFRLSILYVIDETDDPTPPAEPEALRRLADVRKIVDGRRVIEWGPEEDDVAPDPRTD